MVLADRIKPVQTTGSLILCRQSRRPNGFIIVFKNGCSCDLFLLQLKNVPIGKGHVGGPHRRFYLHTKRLARVKIFSSKVASGKTG